MPVFLPRFITLHDPSNPRQPRHLAYYDYGDPANPDVVICVHGLSRNGLDFDYIANALSKKHRVICPDMAGRGNSDWLTQKQDYTYPLYAADCMALLAQLGLKSVIWLGTSMGGIIGMMIAASNPQIIRKLVLNDVGAVVSAQGLSRILGYVGTSGIFDNEESALLHLKSIMVPFGISSDKDWQFMFDISFTKLPEGKYAFRYDPDISKPLRDMQAEGKPVTDIDLSMFWNAITCPTLILRGEHSDILTHETAQTMQNARLGVTLVEIKNAGHAPALLDAGQIKTITDWLDINS